MGDDYRVKDPNTPGIKQAEQYINEGHNVVVDLDLEKFFIRVNHDNMMYLLTKRISDKQEVLRF